MLPDDFREPGHRARAVRRAAARTIDPVLLEVLERQQSLLPPSPARQANLRALTEGGVALVVTGQQVGLFLGPLYTLYKAASAIAVARALEAETGVRCLPLFWLQTEDHDFDEIASCTVGTPAGGTVALALPGGDASEDGRISVAHRRLPPAVTGSLDALAQILAGAPGAAEVLELLRGHYVPGRTWASAFAGALSTIFADEGLLFLDPRDADVARLAAPVYGRALEQAQPIEDILRHRAAQLIAAGIAPQVGLRAGCPLVFFHRDRPDGPRFRLRRASGPGDEWILSGAGAGQTFGQRALSELARQDPLRFSTSALLRPIVQDCLLPTAAYVGGLAEVSYFAQIAPLYAHFGLAPPLVVPRARFVCVDAPARQGLAALRLRPADLALPLPTLLSRVPVARPAAAPDPVALGRQAAAQIVGPVRDMGAAMVAAEPSLARAAERTRSSVEHALTRLINRYAHQLLQRDTLTRDRLLGLRDQLYPTGTPQERVLGWPTLAARLGPALLKRLVMDDLASNGPFATSLRELHP